MSLYMSKPEVEAKAVKVLEDIAKEVGGKVEDRFVSVPKLGGVVEVDEMRSGSTWNRRGTGKLYIVVGRFSNSQKQFRERKDGSFSPEMIPYIQSYIIRELQARQNKQSEHAAYNQAVEILEDAGIPRWNDKVSATSVKKNGNFQPGIQIKIKVTADQLDRVKEFLGAVGIEL